MSSDVKLSLGPLLFNWPNGKVRDFYARIADEAPVDTVHLGEVVCAKRAPAREAVWGPVVERLETAGKEVILSTQALILSSDEMKAIRRRIADPKRVYEANDVAVADMLRERPHVIGPLVNVYNEGTLATLAERGAFRVCLPPEMPGKSIAVLAKTGLAEIEVLVFGRLPLAIAARCYHARAHGLTKEDCRFVCANDPDGMEVDTLDGRPFLAINGTQTLSYATANLAAEIPGLRAMGVNRFRLSPHAVDMVRIATRFRGVAEGTIDPAEVLAETEGLIDGAPNANGFFHNAEGLRYVTGE